MVRLNKNNAYRVAATGPTQNAPQIQPLVNNRFGNMQKNAASIEVRNVALTYSNMTGTASSNGNARTAAESPHWNPSKTVAITTNTQPPTRETKSRGRLNTTN